MFRKKQGFTILEIILIVVIMGVIMVAMVPYLRTIHMTWGYGDRRTEILQQGRVSLDRMVKAIRAAGTITNIDTSGTGNYIALTTQDGTPIVFFHNVLTSPYYVAPSGNIEDNDLVMQESGVNSLLAKSVDSITFTYLKPSMDYADPATKPYQVKAVKIDMVLSDPEGVISETLPLSSLAYCRVVITGRRPAVWVGTSGELVKLDISGNVIDTRPEYSFYIFVDVDPNDGSLWITSGTNVCDVVRLDYNGNYIAGASGFGYPWDIEVNSNSELADYGSCWVLDMYTAVVKLNPDGTEAFRISNEGENRIQSISIDSRDGSCWYSDYINCAVKKVDSDGSPAFDPVGGFTNPSGVAVDPNDGSCWVVDHSAGEVLKIDDNGTIIFRKDGIITGYPSTAGTVAIDPTDGSAWVASDYNIIRLDSNGNVVGSVPGVGTHFANDPTTDHACWIVSSDTGKVVKVIINDDGTTETYQMQTGLQSPMSIVVDPGGDG